MTDYTPTTDQVREATQCLYVAGRGYNSLTVAEFDRWLAEYTQQVGEAIWDDGYLAAVEWAGALIEEPRQNPFRKETP